MCCYSYLALTLSSTDRNLRTPNPSSLSQHPSATRGLPQTCGSVSHLWLQLARKCVVYLCFTYYLKSKWCLLHLLQARETTGRPEDNVVFTASTQSARTKWGATNFGQCTIPAKITGSCSAHSPQPDSPILASLGQLATPVFLLSASATELFKPGRYTMFSKKSANLCNYLSFQYIRPVFLAFKEQRNKFSIIYTTISRCKLQFLTKVCNKEA